MMPSGWQVKPLAGITKWSSGGTPSKNNPEFWNGDIPWISAASMRGHYYSDSELKISDTAVINGAKMAPENSLLLLVRGSMLWNKVPVGITTRKLAFNQDVKCLTPNTKYTTSEFLLCWFLTHEHRLMNMVTGTGIGAGKFDTLDLQNLDVALPPLPEQRKIAKILATWNKAIITTEKLIATSWQQKKALMQQLLTGKKRLLNPETGKVFDSDWHKVKLANICSKITDGAHHSPASVDVGFPMYSVKDMGRSGLKNGTARLISKEDYIYLEQQNCRPLINDILIAKDGSILKHCFVMKNQCDGVVLSSIAILRPDLNKICPSFVAHFLSQDYVKKYVAKVFTTGSGVPRIVLKDFKSIKLKLGSLVEQQKIAQVLTSADKDIEILEAKLAHLKQEKKALMQQLLTGKRRVQIEEA